MEEREGFDKSQRSMMLLSIETRQGLKLTGTYNQTWSNYMLRVMNTFFSVMSFVELVQYLFTIPGVTVFLGNRVCQDHLENFFGQQRQRERANGNPSSSEFIRNTQALCIVSNTCGTIRGNCRGGVTIDSDWVESGPLPKRPRPSN